MSSLEQSLTSLVTAENINLAGVEKTSNGKATSELELSITNGQNIPTDEDERKSLGQTLAIQIKQHLKDTMQFDIYKVLFITKTESGGVTKRNWIGNTFSSSELTAANITLP